MSIRWLRLRLRLRLGLGSSVVVLGACVGAPSPPPPLTGAVAEGSTGDASSTLIVGDSTSGRSSTTDGSSSGDTSVGETESTTVQTTETDETGLPTACGDGVLDEGEACDDANGDELDGCTSTCELGPFGLVFGEIISTEPIGGWAMETFDEISDCGPDEILVGVRGFLSSYSAYMVIGQVQGTCASIELTNTAPATLEFGPPVDLPSFGDAPKKDPFDLFCPPGAATSSLSVAHGLYTDMLSLSCRSLALSADLDAVDMGRPAELPPVGLVQPVEATVECPLGSVATGLRVMGDDYATQFALRCRTLEVTGP